MCDLIGDIHGHADGPGATEVVDDDGIVENGLVKPLDPSVHLPEHARVIIVAPTGE